MMKRKLLTLAILLISLAPCAKGRTIAAGSFFDHFVLGAEWGYTQCFFLSRDYNFITEEGYRVFEKNQAFYARSNAQVLGTIGYRLSEQLTLGPTISWGWAGSTSTLHIKLFWAFTSSTAS